MNKRTRIEDLTVRERLFCKYYLAGKTFNAAEAARKAGYPESSAKQAARQVLKRPKIRDRIKQEIARRAKRIEITGDKVLQELGKIAFSNMENYITVQDGGDFFIDLSALTFEQAAAIQEATSEVYVESTGKGLDKKGVNVKRVKIKLADKKGALDTLAKHFNLLIEKVQHSGNITINYGHRKKAKEPEHAGS